MQPVATTRRATGMSTGSLAVWLVIVSEIFIFGGLLAAYLMHRLGHPDWAQQAIHTNTLAGAINTFILLSSSLSAVLAYNAASQGHGKRAARFLLLTMAGGALFVVVKAFEWTAEIQAGYTITSNGFWSFYYTAAGLHALHVIAGVVIMGFVATAAAKGKDLQRVEYIGLYWHFVDLVWIFLFPLLYIAK